MLKRRSSYLVVVLVAFFFATAATTVRGQGEFRPSVYAIENVRAVTADGGIDGATIVLRDGVIEQLGAANDVKIPFDAERIDGEGLVAYPGLIDAYATVGIESDAKRSQSGAGTAIDYGSFAVGATPADNRKGLTPEFAVSSALAIEDSLAKQRREAGFTSMLVAPGGGIATGQSALVALSGKTRREIVMADNIGLHVALTSPGRSGYPSTLMGCVAHLRQAMLDADQYAAVWKFYDQHGGKRPPADPALAALRAAKNGTLRVFWGANSEDEIHRVLDLAEEFGVKPVIVGGREAWKVADRLAATKVPVVLRIDFGDEPKSTAGGDGGRRQMTPERIKEMLQRPGISADFRSRMQDRLAQLEKEAKQPIDAAAKKNERTVPESPRLIEEAKRVWKERIQGVQVLADQGVLFCFSAEGLDKPSKFIGSVRTAVEHGLSVEHAIAAMTANAATILDVERQTGSLAQGKAAHLVLYDAALENKDAKVRFVFVDREKFELNQPGEKADQEKDDDAKGESDEQDDAKKSDDETDDEKKSDDAKKSDDKKSDDKKSDDKKDNKRGPRGDVAQKEPFPTEIEADRVPAIQTGGNVVIRGATILTVTKGTVRGDLLIRDGKIAAIEEDVQAPDGFRVIDATGMVIMPGIIDTHSHIAISGGVNEGSLAVVPEVRIRDVVTGDSASIFRAVAGGVTLARLLHGSANPIGGQDAVIKLRYGKPGRDLILKESPRGVKFALGENPKRSSSRYPDTRLGVEAVIRRAFDEGVMYKRLWQLYEARTERGEQLPPPRRDLRLEALADIISSDLLIHSHCYRADEILMLMRLAESHGIRVKSLQHVLEGYKVAAEIAAHGASNSTFSDWWAYKIEAYDAIPHNAALLQRAGAQVVLKSDSSELMRHLYQDAAKTMRYGGMSEVEALRTITINAAEQLGLGDRLGSIEVGKDADLAIFNGHPLNGFARCEMTIIDGEVYFQRGENFAAADLPLPLPESKLRTATLELPLAPNARYALINARIVPVTGAIIERGTIVVEGKLIEAVQEADVAIPQGAKIIDLAGLSVYPGMINAGSPVGLTEIGSIRETQDYSERGDYNSDLRASIALNPDSEIIPVTRANGVLNSLTHPSGGIISGQSALINMYGWIPPEMTVEDPAALHVNLPTGSLSAGSGKARALTRIRQLKDRFKLAIRYDELRRQSEEQGVASPTPDPKLQALAPYARGDKLVVVHATRHGDILAAIDFATDLKLDWVLSGANDAWKCVEDLKKHDVKVIVGPMMQNPRDGTPYDIQYQLPQILHEAGIKFAIKSDSGATDARNLPFEAAMAVAYGLPAEEGLKAVTLYPAQLLGIADRLGSIEDGKLANLVICDGGLLQPATQVKGMFINGRPLAPTSRQTRLYDRYLQRLQEVRGGIAPLGVASPTEGEE